MHNNSTIPAASMRFTFAGGFWLTECIFYATFGTQVNAVDCEGGGNVTSGDSKHGVTTT